MTVRVAMWSGPRNVSTALMRSFGNRPDTAVSDEPFYAAYLAATGFDHPMRDEVLASQPQEAAEVAQAMVGPAPEGRAVWYQKHMTHHMLAGFPVDWIDGVTNAFLIHAPEAVLASYVEKRGAVTLEEIGLPRQLELFERAADRLGAAPPVIDGRDLLADPRGVLGRLCAACGIAFDTAMLSWPAGRRVSDGVWAPAWYDRVEASTGFETPRVEATFDDLPDALKSIAETGRPLYERLRAHRLV